MGKISKAASQSIIILIRTYRYLISPMLGECCRFHPTCSAYAIKAMQSHNLFYAIYLMLARILRCHPWNKGGLDLVPEQKTKCQPI